MTLNIKKMIRHIFWLFLLIGFFNLSQSLAQVAPYSIGVEAQVYPTGYLLGFRGELAISDRDAIDIRLGTNIFDHRELGVQDEETGHGFGFTIGYRKYFSDQKLRWFGGIRNDFWWNSVDWVNSNNEVGMTDIFVLQPTAIAGFVFQLNDRFNFTPTVAFGFEVNASTDGEPTGEGAIILGGINFDYRF